MRVHYDADGNVRVAMGPDATLADVLAHKIVVESIQRAHSRGYQIRRVRAAGTEPYKLVEQGEGLVAVPAPERNLRRPDVHARYVGAMDANARSRFDQLNKKSNLTDAEKEELTKLKAANEKRERMAELAEKTDRTPQEEFDLSKLKREARTHNMNDSVGATLQPRDTDTARVADLSAPDKGELSHAEQAELEQIERRQAAQAELEVRNDETRPQAERNKATEHLGNLAAEEYMTQAFPGAERVHMGEGAGTFDQVWRTRDRQYIIVEAKGGGGTNSSVREIDKLNYQQGSEKHAESVAGAMQKSADKGADISEQMFADDLMKAVEQGRFRYVEISQPMDSNGKLSGIVVREYDTK